VRHLLVTNDFPPKIGGIQSYLWELWRRLPPDDVTVLTTPQDGWREFDAAAPMRVVVPPGVDTGRFVPLPPDARRMARRRFGLPESGRVVLGLSRLVPRKGMDTLIGAASKLAAGRDDLVVAIAGDGRDRARLDGLAEDSEADVRIIGRVDDANLPELYGCSDVFTMLCRDRWWGLEQEGFGIVFLEAAACGVPQVAGRSGGAHEAVEDGVTGAVVDDPSDVDAVADALGRLLDEPDLRRRQGEASRRRAVAAFDYDLLAATLADGLDAHRPARATR